MGTVADKLNKLLSTKDSIRSAIVAKGQSISDSDTFASYADKINSIKIWDSESVVRCVTGMTAKPIIRFNVGGNLYLTFPDEIPGATSVISAYCRIKVPSIHNGCDMICYQKDVENDDGYITIYSPGKTSPATTSVEFSPSSYGANAIRGIDGDYYTYNQYSGETITVEDDSIIWYVV